MSLLMEALRKAEQVKKQTAKYAPPPDTAECETIADAAVSHGPQPSLRKKEVPALDLDNSRHEPLNIVQNTDTTAIKPAPETTSESFDLWDKEESRSDNARDDNAVPFDLHLEENTVASTETVRVMDTQTQQTVQASTEHQKPASDSAGGPAFAAPKKASVDASRQTARAVFVAKNTRQRLARKRRVLYISLAAGLALLGAGGYLYQSYQTIANSNAPLTPGKTRTTQGESMPPAPKEGTTSIPARPAAPQETPLGGMNATPAAQDPTGGPLSTPERTKKSLAYSAPEASQFPDTTPRSKFFPASSRLTLPAAEPDLTSREQVSATPRQEVEPAPSVERQHRSLPAIKITRRSSQPQTDPLLTTAYTAYQQGNLEQAQRNYQNILKANPEHRGAMLGLAAVALRLRDTNLARNLYLQLLERDPSDPLARVGLMTVMPKDDSTRLESELKLLLEAHPNIAALSFSLGNIYAAGQRWNEAQQAYFNAMQAAAKATSLQESVSPDYPFNLAVSLEHLNKPDLAVRYYQEALQLAASQPAGFDKEALRQKMETLRASKKP